MRLLGEIDLGERAYPEGLERMREAVEARAEGRIPDTLLWVRHPGVITVGRKRGASASVLAPGDVPVVEVERGGDATYHGPGQQVLYPILALSGEDRDLHRLLRKLEESVIATLARWDLQGERVAGQTGVWLRGRKIASIGVAVRRWVTFHGVALDVAPDPGFAAIRPCGLDSSVMTSLEEVLGRPIAFEAVRSAWAREFREIFGYEKAEAGPEARLDES